MRGIEGIAEKLVEDRKVCRYEDFCAWKDGKVVYLASENCFASFQIVPVTKGEEEEIEPERMPIEKARYILTRDYYNSGDYGDVPFEHMSEEEVREFYLDHVLSRYRPVMFHEWIDAGNVADIVDFTFAGQLRKYVLFTCEINNGKQIVRQQEEDFKKNKDSEVEYERQ